MVPIRKGKTNACRHGGFTLLELLLVLAVVLTVAGLVATGAQQFSRQHRLEQAAAEVELLLSQAHLAAVESGSVVLFCYQPGGRGYGLVPLLPPENGSVGTVVRTGTLPQEISFQALGEQEQTASFQLSSWHQEQLASAGQESQAPWHALVLFLPDGTCQDAVLSVVDEQGQFIRLRLRGLTGTVTSEPLQMQSSS